MRAICRQANKLQYISDLHLDVHNKIPKITPVAKYLAVCGDIGIPNHPLFKEFFKQQSNEFEKVFFVPDNHEFNLGPMFKKTNVIGWEPVIKEVCDEFPNVHYLNCSTYQL